jgi:hypothetical protein
VAPHSERRSTAVSEARHLKATRRAESHSPRAEPRLHHAVVTLADEVLAAAMVRFVLILVRDECLGSFDHGVTVGIWGVSGAER